MEMQNTKSLPDCVAQNRPPPSPLLLTWTQRPGQIEQAMQDASTCPDDRRAIRFELDRVARGDVDPDTLGLRRFWAFASLAGLGDLLDQQRRWHAEQRRGGGR